MVNILLGSLHIKVAQPKKKASSGPKWESNKIQRGVVIEEDNGDFKVKVEVVDEKGTKQELILPFTPDSYELKDKLSVFTRTKDKHGRRTRIIRDVWHAKFHPGLPEQYIPFAKNWIVKGYIVKEGLTKMFDFKDLVGIQGYTMDVFHDEDE